LAWTSEATSSRNSVQEVNIAQMSKSEINTTELVLGRFIIS
jgi:hypothetical protein